jgi:hypothetical protein
MRRWVTRSAVASSLVISTLYVGEARAQLRTGDRVITHANAFDTELDVGLGLHRDDPPPACLPGIACDTSPSFRATSFGTLVLDATARVATLEPDLFLEIEGDARLGLVESYRADGSWNGLWLSNPWVAIAIAMRRVDHTARASLGIAPPLRTLHWTVIDTPVPGAWLGWDAWLSAWGVVPVGLTSKRASRSACSSPTGRPSPARTRPTCSACAAGSPGIDHAASRDVSSHVRISPLPFTAMTPRSSIASCPSMACAVTSDTCTRPGMPVDSMREAVFTVSPQMS